MIRLCYAIPSWILFYILRVLLIILGWIVVPIVVAFKAYKKRPNSSVETVNYDFTWNWVNAVWGNYEDGIANDTYVKFESMFMRILYWSCFRNPVNNLRIAPYLSCKINPRDVRFIGSFGRCTKEISWHAYHLCKDLNPEGKFYRDIMKYDTKVPQWYFAWHGFYSCFYWTFMFRGQLRRLWIGWKIYPTDIYGVTEYRKYGAGFATQFKAI